MIKENDTDQMVSRAPVSQRGFMVKRAADSSGIGGKVTISIDDSEMKVPVGTTILEAARQMNIRIPTLCYHEDLCVAGVCRICVVEVEGQRTPASGVRLSRHGPHQGKTHTRKVRQARRHVLDLLLSKHYGECYACVRNNNCELQSLAREYGVDFFRFGHPDSPAYPQDVSSYSVVRI